MKLKQYKKIKKQDNRKYISRSPEKFTKKEIERLRRGGY
jgi:hypothetical protein